MVGSHVPLAIKPNDFGNRTFKEQKGTRLNYRSSKSTTWTVNANSFRRISLVGKELEFILQSSVFIISFAGALIDLPKSLPRYISIRGGR